MKILRGAVLCLVSAAALSGCGGGGGGGGAKDEILTIAGKVVGDGAGGAQVAVQVGAKPFVTTADAQGNYQIELVVEEALSGALVTILAKLTGERSFVELLSQLGSFDDLQAAAGGDQTLAADEEIRSNVSSLSTAEAVLIEEAEGLGRKAFTFGAGVDPDAALTLAAALELALTDPATFALPEGSATTLELARSSAARDAFVDAIPAAELQQSKETLLANPDVVGTTTAGAVPPELLAATLEIAGEVPLNFSNLVDGFEFEEGGSGRYFTSGPGVGTTWTLEGTRIRVQFDTPLRFTSFEVVDCDGSGTPTQRETERTQSGVDLVLLSATAASVTSTASVVTPGCPAVPARTETTTTAKTLLTDATLLDFAAVDIAGRSFSIPVLAPADGETPADVQADILEFQADGSGGGRFIVDSLAWALNDGAVEISYGGNVSGRYRPIRSIDGVVRVVYADFTGPGGRYADTLLMQRRDPAFAFDASEVPARYYQFGLGLENVSNPDPRLLGFGLAFDAGDTGAQIDDFVDSEGVVQTSAAGFFWSLEGGGEIVVRRFFDASAGTDGCNPQTASCVLYDERILVPVNRNGERYYWLERRRVNFNGLSAADPQTFISRFYDRVPLQ